MWTCTQNSAWLQLLNTKQRWHKFYCSRKIFCTFIPIALPIPIYTLYFYWIDIIFTCHDLWTSFFSCTDKEKLTCWGWELFSRVLTKKSLLVEDESFFSHVLTKKSLLVEDESFVLMYWQRKAYLLRMRAFFARFSGNPMSASCFTFSSSGCSTVVLSFNISRKDRSN